MIKVIEMNRIYKYFYLINTFFNLQLGEYDLIKRIRKIAERNQVWRSYIGMGYHNCCIPHTIMRNIFENPGWLVIQIFL